MNKYAVYGRRGAAFFSVIFLFGFAWLYQAAPYMILTPRKFNLRQTPADRSLPYEKIEVNTADSLTFRVINNKFIHLTRLAHDAPAIPK